MEQSYNQSDVTGNVWNLALQGIDSFMDSFLMLQCVSLLLEALQEYKYKNIGGPKQVKEIHKCWHQIVFNHSLLCSICSGRDKALCESSCA